MNYLFIGAAVLFIILVTIQYSLNRIILLLKEIRDILYKIDIDDKL
ncbi:MAG: hypothetical protein AB2421_20185 [Thermotaleaceae bacterium]